MSKIYIIIFRFSLVNVTLNYGMPVNGNNNAAIASGVELCECDEKFSGASCQNPADGYFRWRNVTTPTSLLEDLVGSVIPCECNGRSEICNKETGECIVSFKNSIKI
jgi:laminin, alpha 1/2